MADETKGAQAPTPGPLSVGHKFNPDLSMAGEGYCMVCGRHQDDHAPTAPVEASGSERVPGWPVGMTRGAIDDVVSGRGLPPLQDPDPHPQPSGENREGPTKAEILGVVRQYCAPAWCSVDRLTDALHAISARPAPVAETAGEAVAADSQPLGDVLTSQDFEALITDARTPKWVNGDYTPTEAMVEAGLEHCRPGNHANMVESFMEMMKQAEIDGLITYASPVPAQDDDRVRIAVEALEEVEHLIKISPDVPSDDFDRGARAARLQAFDIASAALSALKSTAAQEGGAK